MKKFYLFVLASIMMLLSACHGSIWDAIDDLDARVARLEELCKEMNTNISSLQTIVSVLQDNDYITGILPIEKGGETIGYTITFGKHDPITIYNGENGKDGLNGTNGLDGKDGYTPILGVAKDTDGVYYWTLDGEWLLDADGNKLRVTGRDGKDGQDGQDGKDGVDGEDGKDGQNGTNGVDGKDGVTPQLKIENNYWYISYDNGATWTELGKAVGEDGQNGTNGTNGKDGQDGDSMFSKVTYDEKNAYLTLADGTVLTIPLGEGVWEKLEDLEERIAELEALCKEMNTNIVALQTIVTALQNNDYVTGVAPITKDGKTIGYVISFAKNDPITIYNGEDGKDGANGTNGQDGKDGVDGYTPILGVAKDTDGVYYWTLDGLWLLDADGNKLRVTGRDGKDGQDGQDGKDGVDGEDGKDGVDGEDGIDGENGQNGTNGTNGVDGKDGVTPQLKIENNYWYVSYDKGVTWTELGKAVGEDGKDGIDGEDGKDGQDGKPGTDGQPGKDGVDGDSMFSNVTYDENNVYFILTNGTTLVVPRGNNSTSDFDQTVIDNLVNSLVLDKNTIVLSVGGKDTIIATTAPFPNSKVIWSSSDETIVKVENGVVEAIQSGAVIISVKAGTLAKECYVFVSKSLGLNNEYVDLGLSVKWATCNVGATTPEEYGDYFAWGEIEPEPTKYNWSTYKYYEGQSGVFTKYRINTNEIVLEPLDDAATMNWGGNWRMPTKNEIEELRTNCTWTWTTQNGVKGYKVTSKISGYTNCCIFMPAAGYMNGVNGGSLFNAGSYGRYWSSSLGTSASTYSRLIEFQSDGKSITNIERYYGLSVRPVRP